MYMEGMGLRVKKNNPLSRLSKVAALLLVLTVPFLVVSSPARAATNIGLLSSGGVALAGCNPYNGSSPNNAFDGTPSSHFDCSKSSGSIIRDFGTVKRFDQVRFYIPLGGSTEAITYSVAGSNDNSNYTTLAAGTGRRQTWVSASFQSVSYRYVKVYVSSAANWVLFGEVEILDNVDITPPAAPAGFSLVGTTHNSVHLSWSANLEPDLSGYLIYRNGVQIASAGPLVTSFQDTGLNPGATYTYTLRALDLAGNLSPAAGPIIVTTMVAGCTSGGGGCVDVSASVGEDIAFEVSDTLITFGNLVPSGSPYVSQSIDLYVRSNVPWILQQSVNPLQLPNGAALPVLEFRETNLESREGPTEWQRSSSVPVNYLSGAATIGERHRYEFRQGVPFDAVPGNYLGAISYVVIPQ